MYGPPPWRLGGVQLALAAGAPWLWLSRCGHTLGDTSNAQFGVGVWLAWWLVSTRAVKVCGGASSRHSGPRRERMNRSRG